MDYMMPLFNRITDAFARQESGVYSLGFGRINLYNCNEINSPQLAAGRVYLVIYLYGSKRQGHYYENPFQL